MTRRSPQDYDTVLQETFGDRPVEKSFELWVEVAERFNTIVTRQRRPSKQLLKRLFERTNLVLRAYCRPANFEPGGGAIELFPTPVAEAIADQMAYILAGRLPGPIQDLTRRGSPAIGPAEDQDIAFAVAYMKLAKSGMIQDKSPNKTIQKQYGVQDSAVRKWVRRKYFVEPSDFFPGIPETERAQKIDEAVRKAGLRYRQAGRGAAGRNEFPRPGKTGAVKGGPSD